MPAFDTVALTIATHLKGSLTKLHTHLRSHTVTQYGQGNADQIRKQLVNDTLLYKQVPLSHPTTLYTKSILLTLQKLFIVMQG